MNWKASDYIFYLLRVILMSAPASEMRNNGGAPWTTSVKK